MDDKHRSCPVLHDRLIAGASQPGALPTGSAAAVWAVFLALTVLHIYANIRAVRALEMRTLNAARLEGLLTHYVATVSTCINAFVCWHTSMEHGMYGAAQPAVARLNAPVSHRSCSGLQNNNVLHSRHRSHVHAAALHRARR